MTVDESTAMSVSAVFAAVRLLAELKGILPINVFERRPSGEADVEVNSHPVAELLKVEPNPDQTPLTFAEQRQEHIALWGNNYAILTIDRRSAEVVDAEVVHPSRVTPFKDPNRRDKRGRPQLLYEILGDGEAVRILDKSQVLHVPWMASDGINGQSVVSLGAQSFGTALAGDRLAATFFANAGTPSMIVSSPDYLDDGPFERLKREINEEYNAGNAFRSMLLEGGLQATFATMPFRDVQLLESREYQGKEIATRWFRLPAHLAGYADAPSDLAAEDRRLVIYTLMPWLVRDEQELNRKLFTGSDRRRFYVKHNVDAFLRGDVKTRYEAHRSALFSGWKTINEVREVEDMAHVEGGDELPKPAAIWGNDQPAGSEQPSSLDGGDGKADEPRSLDPLRQLAIDTIDALIGTERVHAERTAGKADAEKRTAEFYRKHADKLAARLVAITNGNVEPILDYCERHAAELRLANSDPSPAAAVALCVEGWRSAAADLADALLDDFNN